MSRRKAPAIDGPALVTTAEVATLLRIDMVTVRRMVARGELRAHRIGREWRIRQDSLDAYLARTAAT